MATLRSKYLFGSTHLPWLWLVASHVNLAAVREGGTSRHRRENPFFRPLHSPSGCPRSEPCAKHATDCSLLFYPFLFPNHRRRHANFCWCIPNGLKILPLVITVKHESQNAKFSSWHVRWTICRIAEKRQTSYEIDLRLKPSDDSVREDTTFNVQELPRVRFAYFKLLVHVAHKI